MTAENAASVGSVRNADAHGFNQEENGIDVLAFRIERAKTELDYLTSRRITKERKVKAAMKHLLRL